MDHRRFHSSLPWLALLLAAAPALEAQATTGALAGRVKDSAGRPLAGARIILESDALFAPRVLTTNERGEWRAPLLSPGSYRVKASLDGHVGAAAEHIRVGLGTQAFQELVLKPILTQTATVEVVAEGGSRVDKADSKVSRNYSSEELLSIPVASRTFEGALFLAPGVGGGATGEPSVRGGATNSTLYRVNGVDIKNDLQGGRTGTGVLEDMIEDIQVVTSPLNARYGRTTGGSINVVTKQGSNTWSGSYRAVLDRGAWQAKKHGQDPAALAAISDSLDREHVVTLLGPVIPDRMWFSFGTRLMPSDTGTYQMSRFSSKPTYNRPYLTGNAGMDEVTRPGSASNPAGYTFSLFDTGAYFLRVKDRKYYEGKLSMALVQDHTLEVSSVYEYENITPRDSSSKASLWMLDHQVTERKSWAFGYRGVLGPTAFLEARYNDYHSENAWPKYTHPDVPEPVWVSVLDKSSKALLPFSTDSAPAGTELRGNRSAAVNLKLYWEGMGAHDTDMGVEYYVGRRGLLGQWGTQNRVFYVGGAYGNAANQWLFPAIQWTGETAFKQYKGTIGLAPVLRQAFGADGETQSPTTGLYVNDTWTLGSHWVLMGGLRHDRMRVKDSDGAWLSDARSFSPRFQAKFDPAGDGTHLFTFSAAQFRDDFITGFTTAFVKSASSASSYVGWTGRGINQPLPGAASDPMGLYGVRFINYQTLADPANWKRADGTYNSFSYVSKSGYVLDPNLKAPGATELSLGYARQLPDGSRVSFTYSWRNWVDAWAFAQDYRPDQWVTLSDPLGSGQQVVMQTTRVFNSSDLKRRYQGLDVEFQKRFGQAWTVQGSLTYSRLTGNDEGGDVAGDSFRDNSVNPYFFNRDFLMSRGVSDGLYSPDGLLLANSTFKGRLSLVGRFPLGVRGGFISYAWLFSYDSGSRYSAADRAPLGMAAFPAKVPGVANPVLPLTYTKYYGARGAYGNNDQLSTDAKVAWEMPLGVGKLRLIGDLMVNNLFNHQARDGQYISFLGDANGTDLLFAKDPDLQGTTRAGTKYEGDYYVSPRSINFSIGLKF